MNDGLVKYNRRPHDELRVEMKLVERPRRDHHVAAARIRHKSHFVFATAPDPLISR